MRLQKILILLLILLSLLPVYYINRRLQKVIRPRLSFIRLLLYLLSGLLLAFVYTFLLVAIISRIFPVARR